VGLLNSAPEPFAVRRLEGTYFQIYKKLAYLGLADTGMQHFTNANLVEMLKYSGYLDIGLNNIFELRAYRQDGDLRHIFSEEDAQKFLRVLDGYIEHIETSQNVISLISALNAMVFRREYESNFLDILNDAARELRVPPQELIDIYYSDKKLTNWNIPRSISRKNYLYALVVIVQESLHLQEAYFENCRVVISPQFRMYLNRKYNLSIEDYDKNTQEKFIKEFFQRINAASGDARINYDDFVDGFFEEINYKKLNNFLTDFMFKAPSFGRPSYYITSGYRMRRDPITNILTFHNGVDLAGNIGDPIYAVSGGKVIAADLKGKYGYVVVIQQMDGTEIYYAHCDNIIKNKGDKVIAGEKIATIGQSGKATGPHIHIEYRQNGKPVPPLNFDQSVWEALAKFYNTNRQKYLR
jgi:murein DD-endopeptidase MepM/ murein hydrolase activator NlpD